jgi:hypothetical protein
VYSEEVFLSLQSTSFSEKDEKEAQTVLRLLNSQGLVPVLKCDCQSSSTPKGRLTKKEQRKCFSG